MYDDKYGFEYEVTLRSSATLSTTPSMVSSIALLPWGGRCVKTIPSPRLCGASGAMETSSRTSEQWWNFESSPLLLAGHHIRNACYVESCLRFSYCIPGRSCQVDRFNLRAVVELKELSAAPALDAGEEPTLASSPVS